MARRDPRLRLAAWKVSRLEQQNWEMYRWACGLEQQRNEAWEETRRFSAILAESDQRGVENYARMNGGSTQGADMNLQNINVG